jgi:PAS domain S-box-containing protein/putative nucleotidyltransferase with HDIG domain
VASTRDRVGNRGANVVEQAAGVPTAKASRKRATDTCEELRVSEAKYRVLTETMKDVVWTMDPVSMRTLYVSPSVERLRGYKPEEIIGLPVDAALATESAPRVHVLITEWVAAFEEGRLSESDYFTEEIQQPCKDGSLVWIEVVTHLYRNPETGRIEIAGVSRDITARKQAERALAESDELFRAAFEQAAVGMAQVGLDGRFLRVNGALCKMLGYSGEELLGLTFSEITHPEESGRDQDKLKSMLAGESATYRVEKRYSRKDGSTVWANLTVALARDEDGEPKCFVDVIEDIASRRTSELALQESERFVQSILNTSPNLIYIYDMRENRNVYANREVSDFLGYSPEQIQAFGSELFAQIMHPDDLAHVGEHHAKLAAATTDGEVFSVDYRMKHANGEWRWLHSRDVAFARSADGAVTQILGFTEDATLRIQSEKTLLESYARLEKMVHEVTEVMGKVVEARDPYTQGHERRVAQLSKLIATEMGLPESDIDAIEMAALVHDVGKLSIPTEILIKPGKLSETEFALIKQHARGGYEILKGIDFGRPIADIVLQHHERMDGSGYPEGLVGDEISKHARILAVADVVEAMSSHRPYRPALGLDAAVREIRGHPKKYDPSVVKVCVELYEAHRIDFD